jgi:hypothetical protein
MDPADPEWLITVMAQDAASRRRPQQPAHAELSPVASRADVDEPQGRTPRDHRLLHASRQAAARLRRSPSRPRRYQERYVELITTGDEDHCCLIDIWGNQCDDRSDVTMAVLCRICGPTTSGVCAADVSTVIDNLEYGSVFCGAVSPGRHQIVYLTEAVLRVSAFD